MSFKFFILVLLFFIISPIVKAEPQGASVQPDISTSGPPQDPHELLKERHHENVIYDYPGWGSIYEKRD